ncbi:MAG: ABC transporter permease [Bacillota bacterium]|nr:MAG: hypothetical protein DIU69_04230 [Bacillota bacterium]
MTREGIVAFWLENHQRILDLTLQHIWLTMTALAISVTLGVGLGILITRLPALSGPVLAAANTAQTVPSLAAVVLALPLMGIGFWPAVAAVTFKAVLPIVRNTYVGITGVDPGVREAAVGMGMTARQRLLRVELPLALPVIVAGIKTSTVICVSIATLAAKIGAGGLGDLIFTGIALADSATIVTGAVPTALLAILGDRLLGALENRLTSPGIRSEVTAS